MTKEKRNETMSIGEARGDTVSIKEKWEHTLPMFATIYSSLNEEGKKEALDQLKNLGRILDNISGIKL
tara:strand:- start:340 stop:543 length:204 start_codon:yes stop_codon:yes gene_type:complete